MAAVLHGLLQGYSGDDITSVCETAKRMPVKRVYTPDLLNQLRLRHQDVDNGDELRDLEKERLIVTKVRSNRHAQTATAGLGAHSFAARRRTLRNRCATCPSPLAISSSCGSRPGRQSSAPSNSREQREHLRWHYRSLYDSGETLSSTTGNNIYFHWTLSLMDLRAPLSTSPPLG